MYKTIASRIRKDPDFPARVHQLQALTMVLDGTLYDVLPRCFHEEYSPSGEYIKISERAPSVRTRLCKVVVDDSVAMLFSEGRFPVFETGEDPSRVALTRIVKEAGLNALMIEAAQKGSVGSVVVHVRCLSRRIFFQILPTMFLFPTWRADAPDQLHTVWEKTKVSGKDLKDQGYLLPEGQEGTDWWFFRQWTEDAEIWYLPQSQEDYRKGVRPTPDAQRSVPHGLGFVPMVWIKNLPGGNDLDGLCTFEPAIETVVELDYLMSAGHRALMYQSAPRLVIKEGDTGAPTASQIGPGDALVLGTDGDAKLLEISGGASDAVKAYADALRERALESVHGNRTNNERLSVAQSGKAMEMLHQNLIHVADQLRATYGEAGLVNLMEMVIKIGNKIDLVYRNGESVPAIAPNTQIVLKWGPWFAPTYSDRQFQANALKINAEAGHISRQSAIRAVAAVEDVEDLVAEEARVRADIAESDARALKLQAKTVATVAEPA